MIDSLIVASAVRYLRHQGEIVESSGLGLWMVNGVIQTAADLVAYANDLRRIDAGRPLADPADEVRPHG